MCRLSTASKNAWRQTSKAQPQGNRVRLSGALPPVWMSPEEPAAWLSRWHESEDGGEQPLKASPSEGPRLSQSEDSVSNVGTSS